jgi:transcriptional regulator with XRE-family HTH domain
MGRSRRPIPERLPEKLFYIRLHLALTQEEMVERLLFGLDDFERTPLFSGHISEYERGKREPTLQILLQYARLGQMPLEMLVDDRMGLPGEYNRYKLWGITSLKERKRLKT